MEHPYKLGQLPIVIDDDDHVHGADKITIGTLCITKTREGIRIESMSKLKIEPQTNDAIIVTSAE